MEASEYPQEKKANAMPLVWATEHGRVQTEFLGESSGRCGVVGLGPMPLGGNRSGLERPALEGESPVGVTSKATRPSILSTVGWNSRGKLGVIYSQD